MDEDVEVPDGNVGAVLDPDGELDTTIYVAKVKLNPNERLDLEIVYTSFNPFPVQFKSLVPGQKSRVFSRDI